MRGILCGLGGSTKALLPPCCMPNIILKTGVSWAPPAGGLENLLHHSGNTPPRRSASGALGHGDSSPEMLGQTEANSVEADYLDYCCSVLQHL